METTGRKRTSSQTPRGRAGTLYRDARRRSLASGVEFNLDREIIVKAIREGKCTITGLPFDLFPHPLYRCNPFSPSIDRIDPSKGYVDDNVQVTLNIYNLAKSAYGHEDVLVMADALIRKTNGKINRYDR